MFPFFVVKFTFNELKLVPHEQRFFLTSFLLSMSVLLECKEQFGNFNTRQKKYCEMKTCQGRLVFVDDYGLNGCKFLKTKKSVSPSTEIQVKI